MCYFFHAQLIQIIPHAAAIITQMLPGKARHMVRALFWGLFIFFNEGVKTVVSYSAAFSTCMLAVVLRHFCQTNKPLATLLTYCPQNKYKSGATVTDDLELRVWKLVTGYTTWPRLRPEKNLLVWHWCFGKTVKVHLCPQGWRKIRSICFVFSVKARRRHCIKAAKFRLSKSNL